MKLVTPNNLIMASMLCLSVGAYADDKAQQWGAWDHQIINQEDMVTELEVSESDLFTTEGVINDAEIGEQPNGIASYGTQLAGDSNTDMDTSIVLDKDGIPVDFQPELHEEHKEPLEPSFSEGFPVVDLRSEEELRALDSPMVDLPTQVTGNVDFDSSELTPSVETRSEEELGALESFMVPSAE